MIVNSSPVGIVDDSRYKERNPKHGKQHVGSLNSLGVLRHLARLKGCIN